MFSRTPGHVHRDREARQPAPNRDALRRQILRPERAPGADLPLPVTGSGLPDGQVNCDNSLVDFMMFCRTNVTESRFTGSFEFISDGR